MIGIEQITLKTGQEVIIMSHQVRHIGANGRID